MISRLRAMWGRARRLTVSPSQYALAAYAAMGAFTVIVMSGAAVRLTGSGLGCPRWPRCYGNVYPPLQTHALIEFSNRIVTVPVTIAAFAAWLLAYRRAPRRRDLVWISALLPVGVLAQAVLGGLTVRGELAYGWVMGHFALSMLVLAAAVVLAWRAAHEPDAREDGHERGRPATAAVAGTGAVAGAGASVGADLVTGAGAVDWAGAGAGAAGASGATHGGDGAHDWRPLSGRRLEWAARASVALGALTIFAGTAATAAGPHAGGSPGQRISRLRLVGNGTMDFVIHRHGEIALAFGLVALLVWWLARGTRDAMVRRSSSALIGLIALQGLVGLDQYETHLPTELVWVHVTLAAFTWVATLWTALAVGRLQRRGSPAEAVHPQPAPAGVTGAAQAQPAPAGAVGAAQAQAAPAGMAPAQAQVAPAGVAGAAQAQAAPVAPN